MDESSVPNVRLSRRGSSIEGTLVLYPYHLVFIFINKGVSKEIWICYPIIERMSKARGSYNNDSSGIDPYSASHLRLQCKDFTYYSFDFVNDAVCCEVYTKMSALITRPKASGDIRHFYAFDYRPNMLEAKLPVRGWDMYDAEAEYARQGLSNDYWRISHINSDYKFSPTYPRVFVVPQSISDNVLKHASKFRSKRRIPVVVYKHRHPNGNVIARCAQPLVGMNLQNRSIQDEKVIAEIFKGQEKERAKRRREREGEGKEEEERKEKEEKEGKEEREEKEEKEEEKEKEIVKEVGRETDYHGENGQVHGKENKEMVHDWGVEEPINGKNAQVGGVVEATLGKLETLQLKSGSSSEESDHDVEFSQPHRNLLVDLRPLTNAMAQHALGAGTENIDNYRETQSKESTVRPDRQVDKIFCNIDNIHVMRDSVQKLAAILNDLDRFPIMNTPEEIRRVCPLLQQALTKTQWLQRLSLILQSVDRISKSVHLNNTNVVIHCSDGWDRTSQVSALSQLCLDPYYRTIRGFMVLVEKEWVSFGFKFATRADHGGCAGAIKSHDKPDDDEDVSAGKKVANFLSRAAYHITSSDDPSSDRSKLLGLSTYGVSSDKSPIFHQFLDCVYQILRQYPSRFEFNSRFLKRLFYHYYSCQYGTFLADSERELRIVHKLHESSLSVWDYFNSRPAEFTNKSYVADDDVVFFNYTDVKWWFELYGRSDEEMNGLSNELERRFASME